MIVYLHSGNPHLAQAIERFRATHGRPLRGVFRPLSYAAALRERSVRRGTWIFSDLERLAPREAERAARLWNALERAGQRVVNHPTRALGRYELLRTLHEAGLNDFDVWRVSEGRTPPRFPVFLRMESDHRGSIGSLVNDREAWRAALAALDAEGRSRRDALAIEFCETADTDGVRAKYAAFLVGDALIPRHAFFSKDWVVKDPDLVEPRYLEREQEYLARNPHEALLRDVFARARIDFGRIDYGLREGRIQVWEINTHPLLPTSPGPGGPLRRAVNELFAERFLEALAALDTPSRGPRIDTGFGRRRRVRLREPAWSLAWRVSRLLRRESGRD